MPLHPEIAAALKAEAELNLAPLPRLSPQEARDRGEARVRPQGKAVAKLRDVEIGVNGGSIRLRVYTPPGSGPFPVFVYIHGGGFVLCSLNSHDHTCRNFCVDAGVIVVSPEYRLAPEFAFPVPLEDSLAAIRWTADNITGFGGDPARLVVGGDSAGGNLATAAALVLRDGGGPRLAGQLLIYPVTDHYSGNHPSYREFATGFGLSDADMIWFWDHYADVRGSDPLASPLRADRLDGLPPACVMTAECDVLRDEAERYGERLIAAGVPTLLKRFDGLHHGSINQVGALKCVEPAYQELAGWLRQTVVKG